MTKILWKSLLVSPAILGTALAVSSSAIAAQVEAPEVEAAEVNVEAFVPEAEIAPSFSVSEPELIAEAAPSESDILRQVDSYSLEGARSSGQVTSVSQLSDVQPTDWAFQALQSLVERYGCIAGYPDGTYKGRRAMSRYEFAAGLNACLDRISELIAAATADLATKEDLATLQKLQDEFAAELATLRGRVDALEARTAELEANQYSTTTKLVGEVIMAITDNFSDDSGDDDNTIFGDRYRLALQTSFTGEDVLITRLAGGNLPAFTPDGSFEGTQTFNLGENGNDTVVDWLAYYFPIGDKVSGYIAGFGGIHSDYVPTVNPYFEDYDGGNGALSTFASESPIYRIGFGAGGGLTFQFSDSFGLTAGYLAKSGGDPSESNGFLNGDYSALAQLTFTPSDRFAMAFTYNHAYDNTGNSVFSGVVGTALANGPTRGPQRGFTSNTYGTALSYMLSKRVSFSGFFGYSDIRINGVGDGEAWFWGAGLAFPDLGKEGNLAGLFVGQEPYYGGDVAGGSGEGSGDPDNGFHVEAFYLYRVNDNISITPGVIWLTDPNDTDNDDAIIGTVRTTFTF